MAGQAPRSALHESARNWALAGFYVFPCSPRSKKPTEDSAGLHDATTDIDQIDAWWTENPSYNIGISPARSAMFVLDVDPPQGGVTLASLTSHHGALPNTLTIKTPRGGLHYWFTGECPSSVSKLGPNLDTRGTGGYVLVPPSVTSDGEYTYESETDEIAEGPRWIAASLTALRESVVSSGQVDADQQGAIDRAILLLRQYVAAGDTAIEGQGGDTRTYQVACEILNLGLSPEKAHEILLDEFNPHCVPPWDPDELLVKVTNAAEYAQNEEGAWAVPSAQEAFAGLIPQAVPPAQSRFYPRNEAEQELRPPPSWLIPNMLPAEGIAMMYGPSGSWKSFLALDIALTVSTGIARYGAPAREPADTVYVAAEGARGIERLRRPAWREAHEVTGPLPFYTIDNAPLIARPQEVIELVEAIKTRQLHPKLLIIDTVARAMAGMNENDAQDISELVEAMDMIKRELGCTVLAIHHTGKDDERGARGSSALFSGLDTVLEVKANKTAKAVALYVRKQKDADEPSAPWTFEGHEVASSLVFFETDTVTHNRLTKSDDAFGPIRIGAALRSLGAIGETRAVTTHVLASHITPQLQGETAEERGRATSRSQRQLKALSRSRLEAYTSGEGSALRWSLPEALLRDEASEVPT